MQGQTAFFFYLQHFILSKAYTQLILTVSDKVPSPMQDQGSSSAVAASDADRKQSPNVVVLSLVHYSHNRVL